MIDPPDAPRPYVVSYSVRVQEALRSLANRVRGTNLEPELKAAVFAIDHRLRIYPQFGEPLRDLYPRHAVLWVGTVPPLVLHYVIDEAYRRVMVARPMMPLPRTGL